MGEEMYKLKMNSSIKDPVWNYLRKFLLFPNLSRWQMVLKLSIDLREKIYFTVKFINAIIKTFRDIWNGSS